jgi:hypothetical protein
VLSVRCTGRRGPKIASSLQEGAWRSGVPAAPGGGGGSDVEVGAPSGARDTLRRRASLPSREHAARSPAPRLKISHAAPSPASKSSPTTRAQHSPLRIAGEITGSHEESARNPSYLSTSGEMGNRTQARQSERHSVAPPLTWVRWEAVGAQVLICLSGAPPRDAIWRVTEASDGQKTDARFDT